MLQYSNLRTVPKNASQGGNFLSESLRLRGMLVSCCDSSREEVVMYSFCPTGCAAGRRDVRKENLLARLCFGAALVEEGVSQSGSWWEVAIVGFKGCD